MAGRAVPRQAAAAATNTTKWTPERPRQGDDGKGRPQRRRPATTATATTGPVPPQVDSVANACGTCHGKVAKLFADTRMKHKFEAVGLPGCATCHGNHEIHHPTDAMLGMQSGAVCLRCHEQGKFGATIAGAKTAAAAPRRPRTNSRAGSSTAQDTLGEAERLGMEVSQPQFTLRKASDALTNARSLIHTFQPGPVETALADGQKVVDEVQEQGRPCPRGVHHAADLAGGLAGADLAGDRPACCSTSAACRRGRAMSARRPAGVFRPLGGWRARGMPFSCHPVNRKGSRPPSQGLQATASHRDLMRSTSEQGRRPWLVTLSSQTHRQTTR